MISQHRSGGLALVRKAFVLPILGAVILVVSCSKGQVSEAPVALDKIKLDMQQKDLGVKIVYLTLDKANSKGSKSDSVRVEFMGEKKDLELKLQKVELDENMKNIQVVPDR